MSEDFENFDARLAALEGATVKAREIVRDLYADYLSAKRTLAQKEEEIVQARKKETGAARAVVEARNNYNEEEAAMLATDPRAAGRNDTERKRNAANLIAQEKKPGGKLHDLWAALYAAENDLEAARTEKECAIDAFSAIKHVCHMIAGMGRAIGS
jgi:hypothetical protein